MATIPHQGAAGERLVALFNDPTIESGKSRNWLVSSDSLEAEQARRVLDQWYASFPDHNGVVRSRLLAAKDVGVLQAVDELHVHSVLRAEGVTYEEDRSSPDFRLYTAAGYVAGIEVATQFPEAAVEAEMIRNSRFVDEINDRVKSDKWFASVEILSWTRQPRYRHLAAWLQKTHDDLAPSVTDLAEEARPWAMYSGPEARIKFTFRPRQPSNRPATGIIGMGPFLGWFSSASSRLRRSVASKGGNRYDHRNKPFAVFAVIRDHDCSGWDILNAFYGDDAISFTANGSDSAKSIRYRNGLFGLSATTSEGRNTRISCVFTVKPPRFPNGVDSPITRYDNPFAALAFPDGLVPVEAYFQAERSATGITMAWRSDMKGD